MPTNQNTYRAHGSAVFIRKSFCVAQMYTRHDGSRELRIAQGMPRDETVAKLLADCPAFCAANNITEKTYPLLF